MKIRNTYLFSLICFSVCFIPFFRGQAAEVDFPNEEAIVSFVSTTTVKTDNSVDVTETIIYNAGEWARHGIYRDIYPYSSFGKKMNISAVSVTDEIGKGYNFRLEDYGKNLRIKIGDADKTFMGQKTYVVSYHATRAVGQLKKLDEIYWNVTGNNWVIPIYRVETTVVLPSGTKAIQSACYFGISGSTNKCPQVSGGMDGVYKFSAPGPLLAGEGLTVAVGFPKGIVSPYSTTDNLVGFVEVYWPWFLVLMLPLLTLFFSLRHWHRFGREARPMRTIIPQYDVPDNLTPLEVSAIVNEKIRGPEISAEIIYLATKGYLKISQLDATDYELVRLKDPLGLTNDFDRKLLISLFNKKFADATSLDGFEDDLGEKEKTVLVNQVSLSNLKKRFFEEIPSIREGVLKALLVKNYYKNLGRLKSDGSRGAILLFFGLWMPSFFGGILGMLFFDGNPFPVLLSILLSVIIYAIISYWNPAKTERGIATKEYLLGLKDYLQIAEKDRLIFHNAPDKRPEVFERLLPYAMVLGVADIWAKEFKDIYRTPPSWYSGSTGSNFDAVVFTHAISSFSDSTASSLMSSPGGGAGGSGGGGSSGGGGGGGGGGGW